MTTGALIFAFDNEETDYVSMAAWSARRIRKHLNIPTAIVTNVDTTDTRLSQVDRVITATPESGGSRYFEDYKKSVTWFNAGRTDAYNVTPWEQTLVLDADYVVCSNDLSQVLNSTQEFMAFRQAYDVTDPSKDFLSTFGRNKFPMWWATVMMFRKSNTAQYIFDCMAMIRSNWQHYRELYGITEKNYRNDYALSIALGIVSGHTLIVDDIPWALASVMPESELSRYKDSVEYWSIRYQSKGQLKMITLVGQDFHAMGKKHLGAAIANS
jgi:hypothetical protein